MCDSDSGLSVSMNGSQLEAPCPTVLFIRLTNSEFGLDKTKNFTLETKILDVKLAALDFLNQDIKDKWNYGLFLPPSKGKAGKFLQEDRTLREYPFDDSVGHLELKYKQRIYRVLKTNANKLRKLHVKQNLRQFLDCVKSNDLEKVNKWLNKGLDPNFQSKDNGDTPLILAIGLARPKEMMMALVAGGAHLDYRASDTMTPMHRAAAAGNLEAIRTLLDLGQSPNTKDQFNLSPLYYAVLNNASAACVEALLYDRATLGTADEAGLQEIHQACRFGRVQHLELLIYYGADINSQTSKNQNTPLHICAFTGQEACARMLLFRGAERTLVNRAGHTAYQQAVLSDHTEVAELIKNFQAKDIVPIRDRPKLNTRRRLSSLSGGGAQNRCSSLGRLHECNSEDGSYDGSPGTPSPSENGIAHSRTNALFKNSAMSTSASGFCLDSMTNRMHSDRNPPVPLNGSPQNRGLSQSTYHLNSPVQENAQLDVYPNYAATMKLRTKSNRPLADEATFAQSRNFYGREGGALDPLWMNGNEKVSDTASIFSAASSLRGGQTSNNFVTSASALRLMLNPDSSILDLDTSNLPRMVVLQKGPRGFGFVVRGRRGVPGEFTPTLEIPALQYLETIEPQSAAELAGLKTGDYILEVNGTNVSTMSHEDVVQLIRGSGQILGLKVITVNGENFHDCSTLGSQSFRTIPRAVTAKPSNTDFRFQGSSQHETDSDVTSILSSATVRPHTNGYSATHVKRDPCTALSKQVPPSFTSCANGPTGSQMNSPNSSSFSRQPPLNEASHVVQSPLNGKTVSNPAFSKWKQMSENNSTAKPNVVTPAVNASYRKDTKACIEVENGVPVPKLAPAAFIPPPPPTISKASTECHPPSKTNGITCSSFQKCNSNSTGTGNLHKSQSVAINCSTVEDIDEHLPMPPPPAEIDQENLGNSPEVRPQAMNHSMLRQVDKQKDSTQPANNVVSFADHLREALALRRRKLELDLSEEDEEDDHSSSDFKVFPAASTLYTNNSGDVTVKSSNSIERSVSLSKTGESSFKAAAEKFHLKALSRQASATVPTLPPPEKFKDDHHLDSSMKNGHSVGLTVSRLKSNGFGGKPNVPVPPKPPINTNLIPPPPPIFINQTPQKTKTGL